ncbi:hypothetical protein OG563_12210 [Nocardia vinacea]|uniref:Uncharacterized protein n=1 Tax=Nocardia vinacea TaxID=96468 RepID=A0ABZ1Z005_9NOCA|nr:hypothetical protein [Nocardia vinacea]
MNVPVVHQDSWHRASGIGRVAGEMPAVKGHAQAYRRGCENAVREQIWMDQQAARGQGWTDAIQDDYSHQGGFSRTGEYMRYDDPRDMR